MLEKLVVAVVVAAAFVYAVWAMTPAAARLRFARRLAARTGGSQSGGVAARAAEWLEKAAGGGGQCSGCDAHSATPAERSRQPK